MPAVIDLTVRQDLQSYTGHTFSRRAMNSGTATNSFSTRALEASRAVDETCWETTTQHQHNGAPDDTLTSGIGRWDNEVVYLGLLTTWSNYERLR